MWTTRASLQMQVGDCLWTLTFVYSIFIIILLLNTFVNWFPWKKWCQPCSLSLSPFLSPSLLLYISLCMQMVEHWVHFLSCIASLYCLLQEYGLLHAVNLSVCTCVRVCMCLLSRFRKKKSLFSKPRDLGYCKLEINSL